MRLLALLGVGIAALWVWMRRVGSLLARPLPPEQPGTCERLQVSVIVPARDEAETLPALLDSLRRLRPAPLEVIVVDDGSSDGTTDIARAHGVQVLSAPPHPEDWVGKQWACAHGAARAAGELLLFTDADTVHAPASLGRAVRCLEEQQADLLSVVPSHRIACWWERLQGVFQLLLVLAARAGGSGEYANGQYLLFRKSVYQRLGGHGAVRDHVAEDLGFARLLRRAGARHVVGVARDAVSVRMYAGGLREFVGGWRRNFRDGMPSVGLGGFLEVFVVVWWMLSVPLEITLAFAADAPALALGLSAFYAMTATAIAVHQRFLGRFPAWTSALYPVFVLLFLLVTILSVFDAVSGRPVRWKGRVLRRGPRSPLSARGEPRAERESGRPQCHERDALAADGVDG